eukprot:NODE_1110_length_1009_cov_90.043084_g1065_i0.p1 GENE.NODE_1110_length_1009_cov_90.043084_g1065_i0~~NODE_1110_length_1009_cov_90.043084_g1065_i0.p1  ORF type:complete len:237 (+),score=7.99 NODE_1110_length_1009_cov_90.043084_g1065_i0:162-872(+)
MNPDRLVRGCVACIFIIIVLVLLDIASGWHTIFFSPARSARRAVDREREPLKGIPKPKPKPQTKHSEPKPEPPKVPKAVLQLKEGNITFQLFPEAAPKTVDNFITLSKEGFYDGCVFYRAEPGFCLQGGCWALPGHSFTKQPLPLEYKLPNKRTFVSMARASNPDSATTEFSIMLGDNSKWLGPGGSDAHGYAVFAQVVGGWDVVDHLTTLPTTMSGGMKVIQNKPTIKHISIIDA